MTRWRREIMRGFRTDIVALAGILGGAAVGVGVTGAFLKAQEPTQVGCAIEAHQVGHQIVVTRGEGARAIVMSAPNVRVHSLHDCGASVSGEVTVHIEEALHEVQEAQVRMRIQRLQMQEAAGMMVRVRGVGAAVEDTGAQLDEVRVILQEMEKGSGGQMD
jgi:hypothetical protein